MYRVSDAKVLMLSPYTKFAQALCEFARPDGMVYLCVRNSNDMKYTQNIIPADSVQMYQTHGDHIEAVMDTETFIKDYLQRMLSESKLVKKVRTEVDLEAKEPYMTDVFSLLYGDDDLGFMALIATDKARNSNQFVSAYPVYFGMKMRVRVETVWVWNNLMEATVQCSVRNFQFSFFATDYCLHKDEYIPGREIDVRLAAWGLRVEEADHGFSFEGQQAIDWLAKTGEKAQYDAAGNVVPIHFSTEDMVAFLPINEKCPEEPQFQSPAGTFRERTLLGVDFWETDVFIHRDHFTVKLPLLFRKDMVPDAKAGMPLRGFMWIVGKIS